MFYNHEILTSRKHGVATIWLVATLGSRANSKKVNKKSILEVNIPEACDVVIQPEVPMALRLQSNLLCGISRVYSQQCSYVLVDAQNIQQQMRQVIRLVQNKTNDLDLETGRAAKPDTLILPDDPGFLPDLDAELDFNLMNLGTTMQSSLEGHRLSSQAKVSSQASDIIMPDIQLLSSGAESGLYHLGDLGLPTDSGADSSGVLHPFEGDDVVLPEAEFSFDQDGMLFNIGGPSTLSRSPADHALAPEMSMTSHRGPLQQAPRKGSVNNPNEESGAPSDIVGGEPELGPLYADAGVPRPPSLQDGSGTQLSGGSLPSTDQHSSFEAAATAVAARRARVRKGLRSDQTTEIRKTDLRSWSAEYLANMDNLRKKRDAAKAGVQAKKNAEWWVWGAGLGGIGYDIRNVNIASHPLSMFQGQQLRDLILGSAPSKKRPSPEIGKQGRRVRRKSGETQPEHARDEDGDIVMGLDDELELETARRASTPEEHRLGLELSSSAMPWNRSATAHSSQAGRGRAASLHSRDQSAGIIGLFRRQGSHAGSHLTSASPLHGHGVVGPSRSRHSSVGPVILGDPTNISSGGDEDIRESIGEFDRFGPAAGVDSVEANASQWVRKQLDLESMNFLAFVQQAIEERGVGALGEPEDSERDRVLFEELLRPQANTHVVAAQGLLHVLTLAGKGLLSVQQYQKQFGEDMWISIVEGGAPFDVVLETNLEAEGSRHEHAESPLSH